MTKINDQEDEVIDKDEEEVDDQEDDKDTEDDEGEPEVKSTDKQRETPQQKFDRLQGQLKRAAKDAGIDLEIAEPGKKTSKKSDELDLGAKAFLVANGIKGSKEHAFVQEHLKKTGEKLEDVLEDDYFISRLEKFRGLNKTSDATITGKRGGSVATDSVDYWLAKPFAEVPHDMRAKVVKAREDRERGGEVFYNSPRS